MKHLLNEHFFPGLLIVKFYKKGLIYLASLFNISLVTPL